MQKLNNFQRKSTAGWLLNLSQAAAIAGAGGFFIPGASERIGIIGAVVLTVFALMLYALAMYLGKEVKND